MAVKMERLRAAEGLRTALADRPALRNALRYSASFLMGTALGAARLFSGCGPFGVAVVGAAGTELEGLLCLMGTLAGYLLSGGLVDGVRFIAAMFLLFTLKLVCRDLRVTGSIWFMPLCAMLFTCATGLFYTAGDNGLVPYSLRLVAETVLCGGCCLAFMELVADGGEATEGGERRRGLCMAAALGCVLMSLRPLGIFGAVYLGPFLSLLVVMLAAYGGGPLVGGAAGALFGLCMDLAVDAVIFRCACYALSALTAGAVSRRGRFPFVMFYCAANALCVLFGWNGRMELAALYECFAASVVFLILPPALVDPVCAYLKSEDGNGEAAFRRYQAARMERLSEAFRQLYEVVHAAASHEDATPDMEAVFDRSSDAVCRDCPGKELCWHTEAKQTLATLTEAAEAMQRRGYMRWDDLSERFRMRCLHKDDFLCAVNAELRGMLYRRQFLSRLDEVKTAAYGQFVDIAALMHAVAGEFCGAAGPDMRLERRLGRFLSGAEMDGGCSVFRDGRGRIRVIIDSPDAEAFTQTEGWLEKLSSVVGVRLARLAGGDGERLLLIEAEPLAVSVGIAAVKKDGESISGDRSCYFKTDAGFLCVILSDGMGTGAEAAVESSAALRILEEFLRSGVEPETAMRLLNAAVLLKNGDEWGYATVDLCCIDLFTGQTSFYKYGAAPSYIKTGRAIRRIKGKSMAAGLMTGEGSAPDVVRMKLRPGNVALIASDGVLAEDNDQWLRDVLAASDGQEMKTLALCALQAARERFGCSDDMTAMAIRVEERP